MMMKMMIVKTTIFQAKEKKLMPSKILKKNYRNLKKMITFFHFHLEKKKIKVGKRQEIPPKILIKEMIFRSLNE